MKNIPKAPFQSHMTPYWQAFSDFQIIHNRLGCLLDTEASLCVIGNQVPMKDVDKFDICINLET